MLVDKLVMGGQYLRNNSKKGDHGPWGAWNQMLNLNTHACSAQQPYTYSSCPKRKTQLILEELVPSLLEFLRSLSKALTTSRSVICQDTDNSWPWAILSSFNEGSLAAFNFSLSPLHSKPNSPIIAFVQFHNYLSSIQQWGIPIYIYIHIYSIVYVGI